MRVLFTAIALCALSFFVGVAGDLSTPANAGQTVTLRIPPPIPADSPRAAPLPRLPSTATASATPTALVLEPAVARRMLVVEALDGAPAATTEAESAVEAKPEAVLVLAVADLKEDVAVLPASKTHKQV